MKIFIYYFIQYFLILFNINFYIILYTLPTSDIGIYSSILCGFSTLSIKLIKQAIFHFINFPPLWKLFTSLMSSTLIVPQNYCIKLKLKPSSLGFLSLLQSHNTSLTSSSKILLIRKTFRCQLILDWHILEVSLLFKPFEINNYGEKPKEDSHWTQT